MDGCHGLGAWLQERSFLWNTMGMIAPELCNVVALVQKARVCCCSVIDIYKHGYAAPHFLMWIPQSLKLVYTMNVPCI